jgi:DNA-binding IclR family transcriptional regulator
MPSSLPRRLGTRGADRAGVSDKPSKRRERLSSPSDDIKVVRPVVNAVAILRLLTTLAKPMSVSLIARQLNLNLSTCFYILRTLVQEQLLRFDAGSRTYSVGVGFFDLSQAALARGGTIPIVQPMMENLARKFGIIVTVWRRAGDNRLVLAALAESDANMRIHMNIGQRVPLLAGAMGRIMAAHSGLDDSGLRRRFREVRWQTPLKFKTYMSQVRKARRDGWAVDEGYLVKGATTVSAPVLDQFGRVPMACSGAMFAGQHSPAQVARIAAGLEEIAAALTRALSAG